MGVFAGPDVSESGLVLALDGANLKSFKGEATTNEIVAVTWNGDGTNQTAFTAGSTLVTDQNLTYKGYETYLWAPATSLNCYLNGADLSTLRTSTVWTFSCYVKREDGAAITSLSVYMYYPSSDGSAAGTIEDVGNGWYRVSRTRTGTDNYLDLVGFTGFAANVKYYLSGAQVEKKSYPTTFVATNTTRGTTVATGGGWADLSGRGNNGELVNGVGESSSNGGSLVFDGIDNMVIIPNNTELDTQTPTVEVWVKTNATNQNGFWFEKGTVNSQYSLFQEGTVIQWRQKFAGGVTNLSTTTATYMNTSSWYQVVGTYTSGSRILYINGVLVNSDAQSGAIDTNSGGMSIGVYGGYTGGRGYYYNGNLAICRVYNRVLTTAEIQQNYIATKSRYGL